MLMQWGEVRGESGCVGGGGGEDEDIAETGEGMGREERKREVVLDGICEIGCCRVRMR